MLCACDVCCACCAGVILKGERREGVSTPLPSQNNEFLSALVRSDEKPFPLRKKREVGLLVLCACARVRV
jgi:hypothetical protein